MRVDTPAFLCIEQDLARVKSCVYAGVEIESTDDVGKWRLPGDRA